jgi:hypothetical protein
VCPGDVAVGGTEFGARVVAAHSPAVAPRVPAGAAAADVVVVSRAGTGSVVAVRVGDIVGG